MRIWSYILLFFIILLTPFMLRRVVGSAPAADLGSNGDRLVIVTPHTPDIRREFASAFSQWHQAHYGSPVSLDFRALDGTGNIKRLLQTTYDSLRTPDRQ